MAGFYELDPEPALLLGDVVTGFRSFVPSLFSPRVNDPTIEVAVQITCPDYFVVMTPCCSIGKNKRISLAPLERVVRNWFRTPYFADDLTRINRKGPPDRMVPPEAWQKMNAGERQARMERGEQYPFMEVFVYAEHDLLKKYDLDVAMLPGGGPPGRLTTSYRMLDFSTTFRIDCNKIEHGGAAPATTKLLQLSIDARRELHEKLGTYYARIADEDTV